VAVPKKQNVMKRM